MATQLQIRRGTASQIAAFTGAEGEVVVNTTNDSIVVSDGSTAGGFEQARADLNNVSDASLNAALTGNTVSALTITTLTLGSTAITATGAELNFVDGVTSAIQTQLDAKAPLASPTFTGTVNAAALIVDTTTLVVEGSTSRVGLGIADPNANLHISSAGDATNPALQFGGTTTYRLGMYTDSEGGYIENKNGDNGLIFRVKTVGEAMRIDGGSGNVGIGTSSPAVPFQVSQGTNNTATIIRLENIDTTIQTDQEVNAIEFYSNDASTNGTGVSAKIAQVADNAGNRYGLAFSTYKTSLAEALRIDSSGNVGIGTDSPSRLLHLKADDSCLLQLQVGNSTGNCQVLFGDSGTTTAGKVRYDHTGNVMSFETLSTEAFRITNTQSFLMGETSPVSSSKFLVSFNGTNFNGMVAKTTRAETGTSFHVFVNSSNQTAGVISHNGATTVNYGSSSDQRLKENIVDAPSASDDIDAIQVRSFDWKADGEHEKYGFIAQELKLIAPKAVSGMGMPDEEDPMLGVDPSKLVPMLVKEIQSLRARVAQLENN